MRTEVFFDVETKKLFKEVEGRDPALLGVSIVSVYRREVDDKGVEADGVMTSYWERDFEQMWRHFQEADRIIGFNSRSFDMPALYPYALYPIDETHHFDILEAVRESLGRRIGLSALAKETLGTDKTDIGINAVNYFRRGDPESLRKLQEYCEADVLLTRDLYDYGMKNKHLKFIDSWNTQRQFPVDFSYKNLKKEKQVGLF